MNPMSARSDRTARAEALQRRAHAWAVGAREGKALDRKLAATMTPSERLAEGAALARIAEQLRASLRRTGSA
jgi:hypothetical protein